MGATMAIKYEVSWGHPEEIVVAFDNKYITSTLTCPCV